MNKIAFLAGSVLLMAGPAFAQSTMSDTTTQNNHQMHAARKAHAQAGTVSNGSGSPSDTRTDSVSTSRSGQGKNDPTNPAASGAAAGTPQHY